jgi:hypothetical protein
MFVFHAKGVRDVDRQPQKAFFVYRDALSPMLATLRTDRTHFVSDKTVSIEAWLSNDLMRGNTSPWLKKNRHGKTYPLSTAVEPQNQFKSNGKEAYI